MCIVIWILLFFFLILPIINKYIDRESGLKQINKNDITDKKDADGTIEIKDSLPISYSCISKKIPDESNEYDLIIKELYNFDNKGKVDNAIITYIRKYKSNSGYDNYVVEYNNNLKTESISGLDLRNVFNETEKTYTKTIKITYNKVSDETWKYEGIQEYQNIPMTYGILWKNLVKKGYKCTIKY